MSERRQILTLVAVSLVLGVTGLIVIEYLPRVFRDDSAYVESYRAVLYPDGRLEEEFTYRLNEEEFRMLFRLWRAPLSLEPLDRPYVMVLGVVGPPGAVGYVRDHTSEPFIISSSGGSPSEYWDLLMLAEANEVGVLDPRRFDPGAYPVDFLFDVHPPLEFDDDVGHLNLMLADEHLEYREVEIVLADADYIQEVYPHPPSLRVERRGGDILLTGRSGKDMLLEVEMLVDLDALGGFDGFPSRVDDVRGQTVRANSAYSREYFFALLLRDGARALALLTPLLLYAVYHRYGREREYTVPRYLSTVPNRERRPWLVNQIFKSDALDYDADGFYATILDLHRRGVVRLDSKPGGLLITLIGEEVDDPYERRVLGFLRALSVGGVVDTDRLGSMTELIREGGESAARAFELQNRLESLTTEVNMDVASEFMVSGRSRVLPLLVLPCLVLAAAFLFASDPSFFPIRSAAVAASVIPIVQVVVAMGFPSSLFGMWRGDSYREKLEWDAFTRHLDDLSQIERYPPEDIGMWGEWLVYGTALGVGDAVVRALRVLEIDLPEARYMRAMPVYFHPFVVASTRRVSSSGGRASGSFGGGGFGAGGGFGGGGGGVR
ncbi:MAG: DUF2207 domain-containing protein [Candidatus Bathyarchaeota archaeon]|nr:DUF2207 domain-containing protein [Candidatus Bathyarchaeota archaeon]